ncbi:MAG TPA: sterol desaturase family protein [Pyrinomonadaceae bacterium]|nr:sterol desaturase family protein [Pyrinomonadaceae bacterium]
MSTKASKQFTPFCLYTAVALILGAASALGEGLSKAFIFVLLASGLLSWGLIEYALHRFIFHLDAGSISGRKVVYAAHLSHHENPKSTDSLFASLQISAPIAAGYWLLAWAVLGTWRAASYLFIGLIAGYFCYEWLHFQAHHRKPRLRLFRYLKKYHLMHHYRTPGLRFGVTSPLFDLVFRTLRPAAVVNRPG